MRVNFARPPYSNDSHSLVRSLLGAKLEGLPSLRSGRRLIECVHRANLEKNMISRQMADKVYQYTGLSTLTLCRLDITATSFTHQHTFFALSTNIWLRNPSGSSNVVNISASLDLSRREAERSDSSAP